MVSHLLREGGSLLDNQFSRVELVCHFPLSVWVRVLRVFYLCTRSSPSLDPQRWTVSSTSGPARSGYWEETVVIRLSFPSTFRTQRVPHLLLPPSRSIKPFNPRIILTKFNTDWCRTYKKVDYLFNHVRESFWSEIHYMTEKQVNVVNFSNSCSKTKKKNPYTLFITIKVFNQMINKPYPVNRPLNFL